VIPLVATVILLSQELIQAARDTLTPVNTMGAAGVVLGAAWALFRRRPTILMLQALGSLAFGVQYVLLGSLTGAIMCGVGLAQSLAACAEEQRSWQRHFYLATVCVIAVATYATWHGIPSIAAAAGSSFATIGRLQRDAQRMRLFFVACSMAWAIHNFMVGSVFGNVCDALTIGGILIGLAANRSPAPALPSSEPSGRLLGYSPSR
jgi:hypothetical protein